MDCSAWPLEVDNDGIFLFGAVMAQRRKKPKPIAGLAFA
jgi:hypothetical protein